MFKVVNNILVIGNSEIQLIDGTHTIYLNPKNGQYYLDNPSSDDDEVFGSYIYDSNTKDLEIETNCSDFVFSKFDTWTLGRSMWNNSRIHNGPLYGSGDTDTPVSGYTEGLPIDFNYTSFVMSTMALATYVWTGGRSCFTSLFFGDMQTNIPFYTARPIMSCAGFSPKMEFELSIGAYMFPIGVIDVLMEDMTNYIYNMFSLVYFQYSHRRYTDFQINTREMYSFNLNGKEKSVSPMGAELSSSASLPDFNANLSMFNLMQ